MNNNSQISPSCTVCAHLVLHTAVNFGSHPPANRFVSQEAVQQPQDTYKLELGYCARCGTIQLSTRMPVEVMRPRFDWLLYNEPEGHLDDVAKTLMALPGIDVCSRIFGVTYKDRSTVDRLTKLGLPEGVCFSPKDYGISLSKPFGFETIQRSLQNSKTIAVLKKKYGTADILLARHIVEHAESAKELIQALRQLVSPGGYLIMEFPDSEKLLRAGNHLFIWEEHISYFTKSSVSLLANCVGAELAWSNQYTYPFEDSIVVVFRFPSQVSADFTVWDDRVKNHRQLLESFSQTLSSAKQHWRKLLEGYHQKGEKVAIFGAGHLAAKFINFLGLTDLIDCVIDDHPKKMGLHMPGSLLPIVPSSMLVKDGIKVCISTLSPESEQKVRKKLAAYFDDGGIFIPACNLVESRV
jgi:hypothetical protein